MLSVINIVFFVFHNGLIVFNMFGWASQKTRKLHLVSLLATLFSWVVMGIWNGFGYCLCTDWHFWIRRELGIHEGETSYSELLLNQLPGIMVTRELADSLTLMFMVLILLATTIVWFTPRVTSATVKTDKS